MTISVYNCRAFFESRHELQKEKPDIKRPAFLRGWGVTNLFNIYYKFRLYAIRRFS